MTIRFRSPAAALLIAALGLSACSDTMTSPLEPTMPVSADVDSVRKVIPTIPWANTTNAIPTIPWTNTTSAIPTIPWANVTSTVPTIPWANVVSTVPTIPWN